MRFVHHFAGMQQRWTNSLQKECTSSITEMHFYSKHRVQVQTSATKTVRSDILLTFRIFLDLCSSIMDFGLSVGYAHPAILKILQSLISWRLKCWKTCMLLHRTKSSNN